LTPGNQELILEEILLTKPVAMPYTAEINRSNPTAFIFVIDQSGSMADAMPGSDPPKKKCDAVADIVNNLLRNLSLRCARPDGVRDYFYVGVIGYGATVGSAYGGSLAGQELVPLSALANSPAKVEERTKKTDDGAGGLVEQKVKFPVWFEPKANGGTPMCQALGLARKWIETWVNLHPSSFPPTVIHITDGESTDSADPTEANRMVGDIMAELTSITSEDGAVLLFNVHLSSKANVKPIAFPSDNTNLPDEYSKMLFAGVSPLTENMNRIANDEHGLDLAQGAKAFTLNSDLTIVVQALDIGTRASNLR
jgi:hypothetical protein